MANTSECPLQQWISQEVTPTAVVSSTGYELLTEPLLKWARSVMPCCGVPETEGPLLCHNIRSLLHKQLDDETKKHSKVLQQPSADMQKNCKVLRSSTLS